jgi:hypothetical protein
VISGEHSCEKKAGVKNKMRIKLGRSGVPQDEYLNINNLPYKMTWFASELPMAMDRCARIAQLGKSYMAAQTIFHDGLNINISDSYIHEVANYVGELMFKKEDALAEKTEEMFAKGKNMSLMVEIPSKPSIDDTGYIMADGSMIRVRDAKKDVWEEVKLGLLFDGKDAPIGKDRKTICIEKKDFAVYFGGKNKFQNYLWNAACRNKCFEHKKIVFISDGA